MYCFAYMIVIIIIIIIITNIFNPGLKHFRRYKKETTTAKQNKTNRFFTSEKPTSRLKLSHFVSLTGLLRGGTWGPYEGLRTPDGKTLQLLKVRRCWRSPMSSCFTRYRILWATDTLKTLGEGYVGGKTKRKHLSRL